MAPPNNNMNNDNNRYVYFGIWHFAANASARAANLHGGMAILNKVQ